MRSKVRKDDGEKRPFKEVMGRIPLIGGCMTWSKKKRAGAVALVLVAALAGYTFFSGFFTGEAQAAQYTEYTVTRGDVEVVISGSGTAEPLDQYDVIALVQGEILYDTFEEGDTVEKGQLLYSIDSTEMENTLERASISLERQQMSHQNEVDAYNGLTVKAPISGRISEIYVSKNDSVNNGATVAKIVDDSTMTVQIPFSVADADDIYTGNTGTVTIEGTFETLSARVTKVYSNERTLDGNILVTDVELQIDNPGALTEGTYVTATVNGIDSYEGGTLESNVEKLATADNSGTVENVNIAVGQRVNQGEVIVELYNDSASDSLRSSELSLRDSQLSYNNSAKQLEDYQVTSTISGTVIEKTYKAGDTIDSSSSRTVMAVIADMSVIKTEISVDELDIAQMEIGQEAVITVDALSDQEFTGYVERIGLNGTASMGVTSYPVTIVINDPDGIWPGMNVTVDIVVDSAQDVIRIPVSAVQRGNMVLVEESYEQTERDSSGLQDSMPEAPSMPDFSGDTTPQRDGDETGFGRPGGVDGDSSSFPGNFGEDGSMEFPDNVEGIPGQSDSAGKGDGAVQDEDSRGSDQPDRSSGRQSGSRPGGLEIDQSSAPTGYKYVMVEIGINDDSYIEITWGLEEDVTILVPNTSSDSSASGDMMMMNMGGGMPGGGMQGGGMPSGGGGMPGGGGGMPGM